MTYLKYTNLCADMVRAALKEPMKAKAKAQEVVYFRSALWKDGQPEKQGAWEGEPRWPRRPPPTPGFTSPDRPRHV